MTFTVTTGSAPDTTAPSVAWTSPVGNGGTHNVSSGSVTLAASASDNIGVTRVKFNRWDTIGSKWVDIATLTAPPWQVALSVSTLNAQWNQVNVQAWDAAGNASSSPHIWLYRTTSPDTTAPAVAWTSPVGNGGTHNVPSGSVTLAASASDNIGVTRVKFNRWDTIGSKWVDIATLTAPPWQVALSVSTLNAQWNQVNVQAWDAAGNASSSPHIWLYRTSPNLALPWAPGETWYYTGGPHYDGLSGSVRYAADFAPQQRAPCPGGATPTNRWVVAAAAGTVVQSGNSVVEIEHLPGGLRTGYMHLANIRVSIGQELAAGARIGNPSCLVPPGGSTSGVHVHFYVKQGTVPTAIDGTLLSGWTVNNGSTNHQGTMTKAGQGVRTADVRRCNSATSCGGLRNDLTP